MRSFLKSNSMLITTENKGYSKENCKKELFACSMQGCQKKYLSPYRLKIHLRTHNGNRPFICNECGRQFNEKGNLKTHNLIHTGEKPYLCKYDGCGAKFRTYGHLKDHLSTHFNIRPFSCHICNQSFSRKWILNKHNYVHTGERPFSCVYCERKFSDKSNLMTHVKRHKKKMLKDSEKRALGSQNFQKIENNFFNQITGDIIDHNDSSTLTYFTPKNFSINQEFPIEYYNNSYFKNRDYSLLADYNNVFSNNSNYHLLSTGIKNDVDYLASIDYFQY